MGKADNQQLPVAQQYHSSSASRTFLCRRCSMGIRRLFSVKCTIILILTVAAFLSALFCVLPIRYRQAGFDAKDSIKLSAEVQAYFKLQKPVSELVPYIARLEYDVNEEIGVPSFKVSVLSMHPSGLSNWTDVIFGFVPDPINSTTNSMSLTLLKPTLIDLFLQQSNLTLTSSIFGEPSSFEILKFTGGVTIIPELVALIYQPLLNFTLNSSIYDIKENLPELKEQLKLGLRLMPNEEVYIQVTNERGSTIYPPVSVEASVASDLGPILPERLKQLAQIITGSPPTENLGLDHSVFGRVKEISLSSFLNHSLRKPTPSPSPSPEQIYDTGPSMSPSYSPVFSPTSEPSGASPSYALSPQNGPTHSSSPISDSGSSSVAHASPPCASTDSLSPSPTPHPYHLSPNLSPHASSESPRAVVSTHISPGHSPLPAVAYGSQGPKGRNGKRLMSPLHASSSFAPSHSSSVAGTWRIPWFFITGLGTFLFLFWIS